MENNFVLPVKKPKILVTGAAGFIGMHTVLSLLRADCEVVGVDNLNDYYAVSLKISRLEQSGIIFPYLITGQPQQSAYGLPYRFIKMHVQDKQSMMSLFYEEKFDYVIHLAAQAGVRHSLSAPESYIESNINGFMTVLEACRHFHIKHLLYASSSSVYGLNTRVPFNETDPTAHPASLYAATKKANELMAHSYSHLFQIPTTGLRFFTVYGPWGRPDMALFKFTQAILAGEPIDIFNDGNMIRDFTFVEDVVSSITDLIFKPATGTSLWDANNPEPSTSSAPYQIFNVGHGHPLPLMRYIEELEHCLQKNAVKHFVPMQPGDMLVTHADNSKLQTYINDKPETPISLGIRSFVNWYLSYYNNDAAASSASRHVVLKS